MSVRTVPATVLRVVDGATLYVSLSLGWDLHLYRNIRLAGVLPLDPGTQAGQDAHRRLLAILDPWMSTALPEITFVSHEYGPDGIAVGQVLMTSPQGEPIDVSAEMMSE